MEGLFRGTWYRSAVKLKGDKIIPIPPFEPYSPFDWYYSASDVRQGEKSLHLEFLGVDASKPDDVLAFCERFGVLGNSLILLNEYRVREEKEIKDQTNELSQIQASYHAQIAGSPGLQAFPPEKMCRPMSLMEFKNRQEILKEALVPQREHKDGHTGFINHYLYLSRVHPSLYWNAQAAKWGMSWSSLDLAGLLLVMVMLDLLGPGKVLSCPRCHKFFMTASDRMKYCSTSCYEVFKVQKYQKKKKEELMAAKKGKKTVTASQPSKKKVSKKKKSKR